MRARALALVLAATAPAACGRPEATAAPTPAPARPAAATTQASEGTAALAGAWRVTAVALAPGPVQALTEDDPAYMGAVLDVSASRLAWRPHDGGTLSDVCEGPKLQAAAITCAAGEFGPPDAHVQVARDRLRLDWYDNARLTLTRDR